MGRPAGIPNKHVDQAPIAGEEWRPVVGYEGLYGVSSLGRVRRDAPGGGPHGVAWPAGQIMSQVRLRWGYLGGRLSRDGTARHYRTAILVAEAFIRPRADPKEEVNHKNGIKTDNRASNLEWVTRNENKRHSVVAGLSARGERHGMVKLTEAAVREIRAVPFGERVTQLAEKYGVSRGTLVAIRMRKTWRHIE